MTYVNETLLENEKVVLESRMSYWAFWKPIAAALAALYASYLAFSSNAITMGCWFLAVVPNVVVYVWLVRKSTEMAVTDLRVIIKTGVVKRDTRELYLTRVEGVEVDQSFWGRLWNYGDLRVRGVGTEVATVRCAAAPLAFRKAVFATGKARGVHTDH